jgi:tripartite-type tricarboxylate transporter receptor subunit TctC
MQSRACLFCMIAAAGLLCTDAVCGQNYPTKPIRIVTGEPGGGSDFAARVVAQGMTPNLGQQVVVDSRASAVLVETVAKAAPDGYTLLFYGSSVWLAPLLRGSVNYDPIKDFAPVTIAIRAPNVLAVHPAVAANSVQELIALAKAKPGSLNYASVGSGSTAHLAGELFKSMAGVNIVHIPYKGGAPATNDLIGGQVQLMFGTANTIAPHLKSGRLRALAVTSPQPSELFPGLPTVAAAGLPGYESGTMQGLFAPAGTPAAVVNRLNQEAVIVLKRPEAKEKLFNGGVEVVASTPAEFAATIKSEMDRMGKVIKAAGIKNQ